MKRAKKILALVLALVLSVSLLPTTGVSAASKKVKLNKTKVTISVGKTVTLKLKNNKKKVKWTTSNKKVVKITKKGKSKVKVKGKKAGKAIITAKVGKKKYKCKVTVKKKKVKTTVPQTTKKPTTTPSVTEDGSKKTYTRSKWIKILCDQLNIDTTKINADDVDYDFADIEVDDNAIEIEAAYRYGLLPEETANQDVPYFYPDKKVTRDYMAYTLSHALGFKYGGELITCNDISESEYQEEVTNVVKADVMKIYNDEFQPLGYANSDDVEYAKEKIDYWNSSADISSREEYDNSTYRSGVVDYSFYSNYSTIEEVSGRFLLKILENDDIDIDEGDIVILGENDEHPNGIAVKIVEELGSNQYSYEEPEIEEVYSNIDVLGQGEIDYKAAKTASDDIDLKYEVENENANRSNLKTRKNSLKKVGGTIKPSDVKFTFDLGEGKKITDNLKLEGKVTLSIPEITALLDADVSLWKGISVDELTLSMTEKVDVSGGLYWKVVDSGQSLQNGSYENAINSIFEKAAGSNFEKGRLELGSIPINIAYGFGINLKVFAEISMKGEVSVTYSFTGKEGIQYKDDTFRLIHDFSDTLSLFEVSGSGYIQIGVAADVAFMEIFDIVGVTFQVGPAFNVKLTPHVLVTDSLVCANASFYLAAKFTLDSDTIVGEILKSGLHMTLEHEVLKDDSKNPLRLNFHMENFKRVNKCTFGAGSLSGNVIDSENGKVIKDAMVQVYMKDKDGSDLLIRKVYTDAQGAYNIDNLSDGTYSVVVTATGYKECRFDDVVVVKNAANTVDTAKMVKRNDSEGKINFKVVSAITGEDLKDWKYVIHSTNDAYNIDDVTGTSDTASFEKEVICGNYLVTITKSDYIAAVQNINVIHGIDQTVVIAISPKLTSIDDSAAIRFVLTWGETPSDLDSHLFIKNSLDQVVGRVFYREDEYEDDTTSANLDVDDTSSYGPETITIDKTNKDYTYSYYVYDYSNRGDYDSKELSLSSAKVSVYAGSKLMYTFNVPYDTTATAWKLFDYTPSDGNLVIYNQMGDSYTDEEFGNEINWE